MHARQVCSLSPAQFCSEWINIHCGLLFSWYLVLSDLHIFGSLYIKSSCQILYVREDLPKLITLPLVTIFSPFTMFLPFIINYNYYLYLTDYNFPISVYSVGLGSYVSAFRILCCTQ